MKPTFEPIDDGLEIIDPIERHRYRLTTHEPVSLEEVDTDRIQFPVASAVETTAEMITLPTNDAVYVRDEDGSLVAEVRPSNQVSLPRAEYTLDLSGPLKVYARVRSSVYIYSDANSTHIILDESTPTVVGARSYHRRPAGTITTTSKPTDVMRAVSMFGSALKSVTPERSYPTHRGHPPALELGQELTIPEKFEAPDTDIRISVPPTLSHIYVVTPLAYYLGAEVVPGSQRQLIAGNGFKYNLTSGGDFENTVERVLKQVFFFDCVLRTEGPTPLSLPEREVIKSELEFDIESLYAKPLAKQLEAYLSISPSTIEPYLPNWKLETQLSPGIDSVRFLPFISDTLSIINIREEHKQGPETASQARAVEDFTRGDFGNSVTLARGTEHKSKSTDDSCPSTVNQFWIDSTSSDVISTTPLAAFQNSIGREPKDGPITIEVVCNDPDMREEPQTVHEIYGVHDELPFDVSISYDVNTEELVDILSNESDFFHYIGHINGDGFQCSDGKLDISSLETVNAKAFLLNACQSHKQGLQLVKAGSIGGIVTLGDVVNSGAVNVGVTVARLLNQGFPLYAALDISRRENIIGEQYQIVGDGITTISQSKTRTPTLCALDVDENSVEIALTMYISEEAGKGGLFKPYLEAVNSYYLLPAEEDGIQATEPQLREFFELEELPVLHDETIYWSNEISVDDLYVPP